VGLPRSLHESHRIRHVPVSKRNGVPQKSKRLRRLCRRDVCNPIPPLSWSVAKAGFQLSSKHFSDFKLNLNAHRALDFKQHDGESDLHARCLNSNPSDRSPRVEDARCLNSNPSDRSPRVEVATTLLQTLRLSDQRHLSAVELSTIYL